MQGRACLTGRRRTQRGAHVILACRDAARGEAARKEIVGSLAEEGVEAPGRSEVMQLDLASLASVREFVNEFAKRNLPLHILVNNGGINAPRGA